MQRPFESLADLAACRTLLRGGSRTFFMASMLLPRAVRDPASALYAFCRLADDAIDVEARSDAVARLRERLALAYAGRPRPIAADRALARVVAAHALPHALPDAMLEGFAWDAAGRQYEDMPALTDYAVRVAGSVGAMMAVLMGAREPDQLARACDLGVAMQLSNIARDVGEDARAGRLYLPLRWMREAGIDPAAWLQCPVFDAALASVVARLLREAEALYARAAPGVGRLPFACRPGIGAARLLYAEIGREVARRGFDSVSARAVVPRGRKLWLLARSVVAAASVHRSATAPPLAEARYLVDAVAGHPGPQPAPPRTIDGQIAWLYDLFARLEREQAGRVIDGSIARAL